MSEMLSHYVKAAFKRERDPSQKMLSVIPHATRFLVLHSRLENKKKENHRSKSSMEKIGGWYVMSSAKKRQKEPEVSDSEVPSWKEILESQQTNNDMYSQYARFPRATILPSLKTRQNYEMELQRSSPRPDLYQLNNNWAV